MADTTNRYEDDPEPVTPADLLELDVAEDDFDPEEAARDVAIDEELQAWLEEHKK